MKQKKVFISQKTLLCSDYWTYLTENIPLKQFSRTKFVNSIHNCAQNCADKYAAWLHSTYFMHSLMWLSKPSDETIKIKVTYTRYAIIKRTLRGLCKQQSRRPKLQLSPKQEKNKIIYIPLKSLALICVI